MRIHTATNRDSGQSRWVLGGRSLQRSHQVTARLENGLTRWLGLRLSQRVSD